MSLGAFLENPGNLTCPKPYLRIKFKDKEAGSANLNQSILFL